MSENPSTSTPPTPATTPVPATGGKKFFGAHPGLVAFGLFIAAGLILWLTGTLDTLLHDPIQDDVLDPAERLQSLVGRQTREQLDHLIDDVRRRRVRLPGRRTRGQRCDGRRRDGPGGSSGW